MKTAIFLIALFCLVVPVRAQEIQPGTRPDKTQRELLKRGYGMFIHYGMNTFLDKDWSEGVEPASTYHPTQLDCDQWVRIAREAGFRYVVLVTKHHDGFCLWDSKYTDYDVASSPVPTDIIAAVAKACKKYGLQLGLYYSLWDRHEPSYKEAGGTANGYNNFNSGLGFLLTYDSRDVPANAYRGMYLDFRGMMYAKFIGSDQTFYRLEIDYRQYKSLGKRRVLAWTAQTKNVFGDVPLTQYALTGTPFDLRGYYMGQYRDKSSHVVMAEYRQMLNTDRSTWVKRMLNHIGFVAWTGCGFMGPTPGKIEGVLPNYGVGLRIEVQPRMNVRLDLGKNTVNNQMLFYFNMTEAF